MLHSGGALKSGAPSWVIEDPLKGRFYRIGWLEFEVIARWHLRDAEAVAQCVAHETLLTPELDEVLAIRDFLRRHELLVNRDVLDKAVSTRVHRPGLATRALHNYLMFRIPLVNPDSALDQWLPWFAPVLSRRAFAASMVAAVVGIVLALQQWDHFATTFVEAFSLQGMLCYAAALVFAKVLHELGHAFTAKQFGLRVPRMGVAVVLLLPMLYTDTGETWRLTRRRDRFAVAAAGMRIELMLAAWCTLAWSFLPEGPLRAAAFFLATTSWVMTLGINASPFLRFDGYYMMSDASGIPNLHEESSRILRHFLRARLLGLEMAEPAVEGETPPPWLLWFAISTAIYRFSLFLGIAIAVYHYFFKLLGIFLFAVEIWWFILRPVHDEVRVWWAARAKLRKATMTRVALITGAILLFLVLPWQGQIQAEGWLRAGEEFAVHAPRPGRVVTISAPGKVNGNDLLARLEIPDLRLREARARARIDGLDSRLLGTTGAEQLPESVRATREEILRQWTEVRGADAELRQMRLTAPFSGYVVDVAPGVVNGQVVARQEVLARVIDPATWMAEAFVDEDDVKRIRTGVNIRAYLYGIDHDVIDGRVAEIDPVPVDQLPAEMLAVRYGGMIITTDDASQLKPRKTLFRVRMLMERGPRSSQVRLASFNIEGDRVSPIGRALRGAASALVSQVNF